MSSRQNLLNHFLALVPFDGVSEFALKQAAKKAGVNEAQLREAFPRGVNDAVETYFRAADAALEKACPAELLAKSRVPERIEMLMQARLEFFTPHKEAVRRMAAWRSLPWHAGQAAKSLYRTVDVMWKLAGDTAVDFNFYTKRATLAAVYGSTLLFWLNDNSQGAADSLAFLKRRLADVAAFGKAKKNLKDKFRRAG